MALRSMTGFGRAHGMARGFEITVEVRSVNHKGLDVKVSAPSWLANLETRMLQTIRGWINRGRVNVRLDVTLASRSDVTDNTFSLFNNNIARAYIRHLDQLRADLSIVEPIRLDHILSLPNVFQTPDQVADPDDLWPVIQERCEDALKALTAERDREGEVLTRDFDKRLKLLSQHIDANEAAVPRSKDHFYNRLKERLEESLTRYGLGDIPEERLLQEVILHSERCDITEEIIRARAHVQVLQKLLLHHDPQEDGSVGKKMDFYFQELIRETNTMGSKSQSADIASSVVEMRSEIDRMREQVLNVE
ncbi:MAG: YicC family protein [Myxococcales bacterium]|nr:YicC family protein [Myxococcales bacterium]